MPDPESPWSAFGAELRRYRESRGLTLRQFAASIYTAGPVISRWENGHRPVRAEHARRLDDALGADGHLTALHAMASELDELRSRVQDNASTPDEDDDMERRAVMRLLASLSAGAALPLDALNMVTSKVEHAVSDHARLDLDEWAWTVYEHVHRFRAVEPGAMAGDLMTDFVEIGRLLQGVQSPITRAGLSGVGAQLAALMALDLGDVGQVQASRRLYATARRLADASGDRDLRVWVRAEEAKNGFYDGRPAPVVLRLADEAIGIANGPSPGLALAYGARARVLATHGQGDEARTALHRLSAVCECRPADTGPPAWQWQGGGLTTTESYVYALLGDGRAAESIDRVFAALPSGAHASIANLQMIQALQLVRERHVDDGLGHAARTLAGMPLSAPRRMITGQILAALPPKARELPAARELKALTAT